MGSMASLLKSELRHLLGMLSFFADLKRDDLGLSVQRQVQVNNFLDHEVALPLL